MFKKNLPVLNQLPATYPEMAYLFSIISRIPGYKEWVYSTYFDMNIFYAHYAKGNAYLMFAFKDMVTGWEQCPFCKIEMVKREEIKKTNATRYFINCIQKNKYIYTLLDNYYIDICMVFRKEHFSHNAMINGYDGKHEKFFISEFWNRKYNPAYEVPFHQVEEAWQKVPDSPDYPRWNGNYYFSRADVLLLQPVHGKFKFSLARLVSNIKEYMAGTDVRVQEVEDIDKASLFYQKTKRIYETTGVNGYEMMKMYVRECEFLTSDNIVNYVPFQAVMDHKILVSQIFQFLKERFPGTEEHVFDFKEPLRLAYTLRSSVIKYNFKRDASMLKKACQIIDRLKETEMRLLEKMVLYLETKLV